MFPCRRAPVAIELENHIGLGYTNIVKRHPLRSIPRLGEEGRTATQPDQVRRQVPARHEDPVVEQHDRLRVQDERGEGWRHSQ